MHIWFPISFFCLKYTIILNLNIITVNIEDSDFQKLQESGKKKCTIKGEIRGKRKERDGNGEKATDDYHYERFKKQFRRF